MKKIAILGFGTVGSGVYELIRDNAEKIEKTLGEKVSVKYILDIRDFSNHPDAHLFTNNFNDILEDDEVSLVAEVIGGVHPAYDFTCAALSKGKHVVTSNKELVATKGDEILRLAKENNALYLFEASCGGGIPFINPLTASLSANEIGAVEGILNGTTNYILTEMFSCGKTFEEALAEAQSLGYAEKNPSADVDGIDSCRKISILMSLASGKFLDCNRIHTEGIREIEKDDVSYAEKLGMTIKLIGYGYNEKGKLYASVCPSMIENKNPLSSVTGVYNGIYAWGNAVGDVMFYGMGAGKMPTASAVAGDICNIFAGKERNLLLDNTKETDYISYHDAKEQYFIRTKESQDKIKKLFGEVEFVSLPDKEECAFIAPEMTNGEYEKLFSEIKLIKKIRVGRKWGRA